MPNQWDDHDLRLKQVKVQSPTVDEHVRYGQKALNALGYTDDAGRRLAEDGRLGPRTAQAIRKFQTHQKLTVSGTFDHWTWYTLDWIVYDGWKPAPTTLTTHKPGCAGNCTAIVNGKNYHTGIVVNDRGLTRETQRLADVCNLFVPLDFRRNFAVDRNQRGTDQLSFHALGEAPDLMTDADRDKVLEPMEYQQCDALADYLVTRSLVLPLQYHTRPVDWVPQRLAWRGLDRLTLQVWTNHRMPEGTKGASLTGRYRFSETSRGKDFSYNVTRGTWKGLSGVIHWNHMHVQAAPGAPRP